MGSSIVNRFATMVLLVGFVAQLSVAVPRVRLPAAVVEEVGPSEELASKIVATPLKSSAHAPSSNSVNVRKNSSATQQRKFKASTLHNSLHELVRFFVEPKKLQK